MPLLSLPNELLLQIAEDFQQPYDLSQFILTNRRLASLLTPVLHSLAIQDKEGVNALQWAALQGHEGLIKLLLKKGFNINFQDSPWLPVTALYLAVGYSKEGAVRLLLENKANVNLQDSWGYTALHISVTGRKSERVIRMLLEGGADHTITGKDGKTALHLAALDKQESAVRLLLEKGADPNAVDHQGATPLHLATWDYKPLSLGVVRLLLENGADVTRRGYDGRTALYLAAKSGVEAVVELVLKYAGDTVVRFNITDGRTALHAAAFLGCEGVVKQLLEIKGVDVNFNLAQEDSTGRTALDLAALVACERPKISGRGQLGESVARKRDLGPTINLLMNKSGLGIYKPKTLNQVLFWAVGKGDEDLCRLLLENGANIAARRGRRGPTALQRTDGRGGDTLLHVAAEYGHESLVRFLLEMGADVNAINDSGETPLGLYYRHGLGGLPPQKSILNMLWGE